MARANFSSGIAVQKKKSGHIKNLPYDILLDILSRLPVESVLGCKLVCKGLLKLLQGTTSFFKNMHVTRQLNQLYGIAAHGDKLDMGILFCGTIGDSPHGLLLFYGGLYNDKINTDHSYEYRKTLKKVRHPPMYSKSSQCLVNSCNGLICLGMKHHKCVDPTYIYNLVTGEYVNLPKLIVPPGSSFPRIARGFGYLPSTDEYKVVRIFYPDLQTTGQVQVYTLGGGCGWRTKRTPIPWVFFEPPACFVNGILYWYDYAKIYGFDLANEELQILSSPCYTLDQGSMVGYNFGIVELRGNLCFFNQALNAPHTEIWSLKMNESWCKDFSIVYEKQEALNVIDDFFCPIIITKKNEIIFMRDFVTIECYDTKTTTWKEIVGEDFQFFLEDISVVPHMNTFVSLRSLGEKSNKKSCRNKMFGQLNVM